MQQVRYQQVYLFLLHQQYDIGKWEAAKEPYIAEPPKASQTSPAGVEMLSKPIEPTITKLKVLSPCAQNLPEVCLLQLLKEFAPHF